MQSDDRCHRGFTLVEMMTALAIGSVVLTAVLTSYIFSLKGFRALSNYTQIHSESRRALDWFARDARQSLAVASYTPSQITLILPAAFDASGTAISSNLVTYNVDDGAWLRTVGGISKQLAANVSTMTFTLYDSAGNVTTQASRGVSVQIDALLQQHIYSQTQSEDVVSSRLLLRNGS